MTSDLEKIIEKTVNVKTDFNMGKLFAKCWPLLEKNEKIKSNLKALRHQFKNDYQKLAYSLLRNVFLIELVKVPKIETTKFRTRWDTQLNSDPRFASFEECLSILVQLISDLPNWLKNQANFEALSLSFTNGLIPYEIPLDYLERKPEKNRIHTAKNLKWFNDTIYLRTLKLRKYLTDDSSPDKDFFRTVLADKIKVKTYLTDRVLTGDHKTNREKRWETHPDSVHFAERRTCIAIEHTLVTQLCSFDKFPDLVITKLQTDNILPSKIIKALCPITGDLLSYDDFKNNLLNPTHGKSDFQVGHLNPLKLDVKDDKSGGHTADNISWISADGNRIQGSLSLENVRTLIKRIAENYKNNSW